MGDRARPVRRLANGTILLSTVVVVVCTTTTAVAQDVPENPAPSSADDEADIVDEVFARRPPTKETTASSRAVDAKRIATMPKRNAEDLLRLSPGVLVVQHGSEGKGHQIFVRGFDAAHGTDVEVTLAGVPLNEVSNVHGHGYLDLNFIIPETVESLEIVKGPYELPQGNLATAGSIRFELGVPKSRRGATVGYEVGTSNRHRGLALWAPRDAPVETFVAAEALHDDGYGTNRQTERASLMAQHRLVLGKGDLDVVVAGYGARFGLPGALRRDDIEAGRVDFYDAYEDDTDGTSTRALTTARYRLVEGIDEFSAQLWAGARRLDLEENFTGFLLYPDEGDRRHQRQTALTMGARLTWNRLLPAGFSFDLGTQWQGERIQQFEEQIGISGRLLEVDRELALGQQQFGSWVGTTWSPSPRARVSVGVRGDMFHVAVDDDQRPSLPVERLTLVTASPRLSGAVEVAKGLTFFSSYGHGFRSPEARAALPTTSTRDRVVEEFDGGAPAFTVSRAAEAGTRYRTSWLALTATGFGTWIDNETLYDHVSGINLLLNPTRRLGVELSAEVEPWSWLNVRSDVSLVDAVFTGSGEPVPSAPTVLATGELTLGGDQGFHSGVRGLWLGERALPNGATAGNLATLDALVGYRGSWYAVDLSIDNVLAQEYAEGQYHFASRWDRTQPPSALPTLHQTAGPPLTARLGAALTF